MGAKAESRGGSSQLTLSHSSSHPFLRLSIHQSSDHPSFHPSIHPPIHPSIRPPIHPSICPFVFLLGQLSIDVGNFSFSSHLLSTCNLLIK